MKQFRPKLLRLVTNFKTLFFLILLSSSLLISCKKEKPLEAAYFALIDNTTSNFAKKLSVSPDGGTRTLTIISNRDWSIEHEEASWLTITPTQGSGTATITLTIAPNEGVGEISTTMDIINNTLKVVTGFVITRQDYIGSYKGTSTVASPIEYIASVADKTGALSTINATIDIANPSGSEIVMTSKFVIKTGITSYFTVEIPVTVSRKIETVDGKTQFVFEGTGNYDMTDLGISLGDDSVKGVKKTYVKATLSNDVLNATFMIDPNSNNTAVNNQSTVFTVKASKS